jgi:PAB-dependent poly(A)-specific ribonuclease subunit 2
VQVVDTVDLFHAGGRSRRLSLRFLASWLLRASIQAGGGHDSIEDARAALSLWEVHCRLESEGRLAAAVQEMYSWGQQHGWEPVTWRDGTPHPAPAPGLGAQLGVGASM